MPTGLYFTLNISLRSSVYTSTAHCIFYTFISTTQEIGKGSSYSHMHKMEICTQPMIDSNGTLTFYRPPHYMHVYITLLLYYYAHVDTTVLAAVQCTLNCIFINHHAYHTQCLQMDEVESSIATAARTITCIGSRNLFCIQWMLVNHVPA